jgi:hypothetical protein
MLTNIVLLSLATIATPRLPAHAAFAVRPRIEVWSSHGDAVYKRGQGVRVYVRADQDAFVTLFRVDTDGRVRVLFPRDPWEDNFVRGGRDFEVLGASSSTAFYVDDYPGVGYLFGVVAADPFDYGAIQTADHWDYRTIADGRVRGDPYVALTELAERIVPEGYEDWDYDIVPYHVQQHYEYPRFLCYDCHAYASYTYWDPYWRSCVRFRIVYYDDPYYYPYRYYRGNVVFVRPYRPQPRYVFKDRDGSGNDTFVSRGTNRPVNDDTRRVAPARRDPGSVSYIPAPRDRPRPGSVQPAGRASDRDQVRRIVADRDQNRSGNRDSARDDDRSGGKADNVSGARRSVGEASGRTRVPSDQTRSQQPRVTPSREAPPATREVRPAEPRYNPRAGTPRAETPRATPQREPSRAERPRSEPKASEPKDKAQPELRRRKPE